LISPGLYKTKDAFANTFWLNADWVEMTYCTAAATTTITTITTSCYFSLFPITLSSKSYFVTDFLI
jgi:hypothetical protein